MFAPQIRTMVARRMAASAPPPPAGAPRPATANPSEVEELEEAAGAESEDELWGRLIEGVCDMFLEGRPARSAAAWIVDVENRPDLYQVFRDLGPSQTCALLESQASQIPSVAQALGRRAELERWLETMYQYQPLHQEAAA